MRRLRLAGVLLAALALLVPTAACSTGGEERVLDVLGTWVSDDEREAFLSVVEPFEKKANVRIRYTGSRDVDALLANRVQDGDPPDLAFVSSPGDLLRYARAGDLSPLDGIRPGYGDDWLLPGRVGGRQMALVVKASLKSLVWYNRRALADAGHDVPRTWEELVAVSRELARAGTPPWCVGLASSTASGWPGTDWIEDLVLTRAGPAVYDRWAAGELSWESPQIADAWREWGRLLSADGGAPGSGVAGGPLGALLSDFARADDVMAAPPRCVFEHQASFMAKAYAAKGPDHGFLAFPAGDGTPAREVAGDLVAMFKSSPQARELVAYLTSTEAQTLWARTGTALSPDPGVDRDAYGDPTSRALGDALADAESVRFDASDLMPAPMRSAFQMAVLEFVDDPASLDRILRELERVRLTAY